MTDAEIDALALELLNKVVLEVNEIAPQANRIMSKANGQFFMEFVGTSKEGLGAFKCRYDPLPPIRRLVADCERLYDEFEVTITNRHTNQTTVKTLKDCRGDDRLAIIQAMASSAALQMVGSFYPKLTNLLAEGLEDGLLLAEGVLIMIVAASPDDSDEMLSHAKTDMSEAIEKVAQAASEKRRKHLQDHLAAAPHVTVKRSRGRKPKTTFEQKTEAAAYAAKVEATYRKLRTISGAKPTKVSVADSLGEGGIDPKRGSDTRLNTFNLKLGRLGINYDEIANRVEGEVHNNSL